MINFGFIIANLHTFNTLRFGMFPHISQASQNRDDIGAKIRPMCRNAATCLVTLFHYEIPSARVCQRHNSDFLWAHGRRIAALCLLQHQLDANDEAVKANTYRWPSGHQQLDSPNCHKFSTAPCDIQPCLCHNNCAILAEAQGVRQASSASPKSSVIKMLPVSYLK